MKKRYLFILLLFFLGIYGLTQFSTQDSAQSFNTNLLQVDTAQVTAIVILQPAESRKINLQRTEKGWQITDETISTVIKMGLADSLLTQLAEVKSSYVATKDTTEWKSYGMKEANATRVEVFIQQDKVEDFLIGQFPKKRKQQEELTYIRLTDEQEVYAIKSFDPTIFNRKFNDYRLQKLIEIPTDQQIEELRYQIETVELRAELTVEGWKNEVGERLNIDTMNTYRESIRKINTANFADSFNEIRTAELPKEQLIVTGRAFDSPITITAYQDTTLAMPYILHSSQFPNTFFASDSSGVYRQIFTNFLQQWQ